MNSQKRALRCRIEVPEDLHSAVRWTLECLLKPLGFAVHTDGVAGADADLVYAPHVAGETNACHLQSNNSVIERMLARQPFRAASFSRQDFGDVSLPVLTGAAGPPDILMTAFFFLSGYDELTTIRRDRHGRYRYRGSLVEELDCAGVPTVDYVRLHLRQLLHASGIDCRDVAETWSVSPTVDVDYLTKWRPGILYREFIQNPMLNREQADSSGRLARLSENSRELVSGRNVYRESLDFLSSEIERRSGTATFFIKTGAHEPYDVAYRLDGYLAKNIQQWREKKHEVALHPSYWAAEHADYLNKEIDSFSKAVGYEPTTARQHYLRWSQRTQRLYCRAGLKVDSTLGFADFYGFRRGTAFPFYLFDWRTGRPTTLIEAPLVAMDSSLFNRLYLSTEGAIRTTTNLLHHCRRTGGCPVLLWHNIIRDPVDCAGWDEHFVATMDYAHSHEAAIISVHGMVSRLRDSGSL